MDFCALGAPRLQINKIMKYTTNYLPKLSTGSFKSALEDITINAGIETHADRVQNQVVWLNHKPGDIIFAQHLRELMMAINSEVQARNEALKNSSNFETNGYYNNASIIRNNIATSGPMEFVRQIFVKYLGDSLPQTQIPGEIKNLEESSMLVISYRTAFARLPYKLIDSKILDNGIQINLKETFNYFYDSLGINPDTNTKLDDLYTLRDLLAKKPEKTPNLGVIKESGEIFWFNNIKVSNIKIQESNEIKGDLVERPENWTSEIGLDESTEIGGNLKYAKSRKDVLEKDYESNIEWQNMAHTFSITLTLSWDAELESILDETLESAIITAQRLNKYKEYANKLSSACICNCNYCTCDCNYCTCDCNYCTCNCNYCTCNCNYCTCNCNYKYIEPENQVKQYPSSLVQMTKSICSCDSNRKEYEVWERYRTGKKWYNWCYRREWETRYAGYKAACPTNRDYLTTKDGKVWMAPHTEITLDCVCDSNYTENNYKTSFFANSEDNTEFNKKGSEEIPNLGPSFSTAETFGDGQFVDKRKVTKQYQICTCDVNVKLKDTEKTYYDVSDYYTCSCNTNKNWKSGVPYYAYAPNDKFTAEGYKVGESYPTGEKTIKYKEATCPANREISYLTDWTQFWNATNNKPGPETK